MSLTTLEQHEDLWNKVLARRCAVEQARLKAPEIEFYDGDYVLRGIVAGWRAVEFEFIENDTGIASVQLSLDHYLAKWVMEHRGRTKRNVHVVIEKSGARWSGRMDHYQVVREESGDAYIEIVFKHDYDETKHILCWANPFLRPELQFPKLWIVFGPARWCLLLTLFVNLLRLETSWFTLPDNPLDLTEWMGPSFWPGFWRNIVKPFPLLADNSNLTIVFSRFKMFHDVAKHVLADAQLTIECRRYLHDRDEHPFTDLQGIWGIPPVEDLLQKIPLRHGCLVWDIVDKSGWGTETAFGGSFLTGFIRAVVNIASDGTTEGVDVFTGQPTFPGEYYVPWFLGTSPQAPHVVFEEGPFTGIKSSEFKYTEATDTSFVTGGASMPGVNEAISAVINIGGDLIAAHISAGFEVQLPPLGGLIDAVAKPLYENVFLAFMEIPTLRAAGLSLPISGLEDIITGLGEFHYYEGWADGADKAFTISALMAVRAKIWATRAHTSHTVVVSDAAPYVFGEKGFGHCWLGDRVGTTVLGYPIPDQVFIERIQKISYKWTKDGPEGWKVSIGYREPEDPVLKAMEMIQELNGALGQLGIL